MLWSGPNALGYLTESYLLALGVDAIVASHHFTDGKTEAYADEGHTVSKWPGYVPCSVALERLHQGLANHDS